MMGNAWASIIPSSYPCYSNPELQFLNNIFQVDGVQIVDEPMEEEADSCQVSTFINRLCCIFKI